MSVSEFRELCEIAGGDFFSLGGGRYVCSFDGWEMECSTSTNKCTIYCDPGIRCVERRGLPERAAAALPKAADRIDGLNDGASDPTPKDDTVGVVDPAPDSAV